MPVTPVASSAPRVLVLDDGKAADVFIVLGLANDVLRVRSPFLFEIGEELRVRIENDGAVSEATARVTAHVPSTDRPDEKITELQISEQTDPKRIVSG